MRIKRFADIILRDKQGRLIDLDQYVSEEDSIFYESQADMETRLKGDRKSPPPYGACLEEPYQKTKAGDNPLLLQEQDSAGNR